MAASSFSRHHNGDQYWSRVFEASDELRAPLRNIARGKRWESLAAFTPRRNGPGDVILFGVAQGIVISEDAWRPREESAEEEAVRLSARDMQRALVNLRYSVAKKRRWKIDLENDPLITGLNAGLAVVGKYAWPPEILPAVFIGRRIVEAIRQVNLFLPPGAPAVPTGLGSSGVVIGLVCEALDRLNRKKNREAKAVDPVLVRKLLTKNRADLGV